MRHTLLLLSLLMACTAPSTSSPVVDADAGIFDDDGKYDRITPPGGRALRATLDFPALPADATVLGTITFAGRTVDYRHPELYRDMLVSPNSTCATIASLREQKTLCGTPDAEGRLVLPFSARRMTRSRDVLLASWDLPQSGVPYAFDNSYVWVVPSERYALLRNLPLGDERVADFDILSTVLEHQVTLLPPLRELPTAAPVVWRGWRTHRGSTVEGFRPIRLPADHRQPVVVDTEGTVSVFWLAQENESYVSSISLTGDTVQLQRLDVDPVVVPMRDGSTVPADGQVIVERQGVRVAHFPTGQGVDLAPGLYSVSTEYRHPETNTTEIIRQSVDLTD